MVRASEIILLYILLFEYIIKIQVMLKKIDFKHLEILIFERVNCYRPHYFPSPTKFFNCFDFDFSFNICRLFEFRVNNRFNLTDS